MKRPHEEGGGAPALLVPRFRDLPHPPRSARVPRVMAAAVAAAGTITLTGAVVSSASERLEPVSRIVPLAVGAEARSVAAIAGLGLLVIAGALTRRQRRAGWVAFGLLVVGAASHLLRGFGVVEAGVDLGLAAVLVMARREFDAKPAPATMARAVVTLPVLAAL